MHPGSRDEYHIEYDERDHTHVKVDRSSALGNPYRMSCGSAGERDTVCDSYAVYFSAMVNNDKALLESLEIPSWYKAPWFRSKFMQALGILITRFREYRSLKLFCWCAPDRCHAETIRDYVLLHA